MEFKPNLIPNNKKDNPLDILEVVSKDPSLYTASIKLDGVRAELIDGELKGRSLKPIKSKELRDRYAFAAKQFDKAGVIVEGEIWKPNAIFNEILGYVNAEQPNSESRIKRLQKELATNQQDFNKHYGGKSIMDMCRVNTDYKVNIFDCYVKAHPEWNYVERMSYICCLLNDPTWVTVAQEFRVVTFFNINNYTREDLENLYNRLIDEGHEGLVFSKKTRLYNMGRNTLRSGEYFKLKDDSLEYDGVVLDVVEGTVIKEGIERTTNELGNSVTSKLKEDREPSGYAKGILTEYEGVKHIVSLKGFTVDDKRELLENKSEFIGKWFTYAGMKPVKDVPRHAQFKNWRDSK